jgi:hypothetical protein
MITLYIYSTRWHMKLAVYARRQWVPLDLISTDEIEIGGEDLKH